MDPVAKRLLLSVIETSPDPIAYQTMKVPSTTIVNGVKSVVDAAVAVQSVHAPATTKLMTSRQWFTSPDGTSTFYISEFGYLHVFTTSFTPAGSPVVFTEVDLSCLPYEPTLTFAVPLGGVPAMLRGLHATGYCVSSQEASYTWTLPGGINALGDRSVLEGLTASGRIRAITVDDVPVLLAAWCAVLCSFTLCLYHLENVRSCRKYTTEVSIGVFMKDISLHPSVCIVSEDKSKLVGWFFVREDGMMGSLYVDEAYRGRGFGKALVQALCERQSVAPLSDLPGVADTLRMEGMESLIPLQRSVFMYSANWNKASQSLFRGMGFCVTGGATWLWPVRVTPTLLRGAQEYYAHSGCIMCAGTKGEDAQLPALPAAAAVCRLPW